MKKEILFKKNNLRLIETTELNRVDDYIIKYAVFKLQIKKFGIWITFKKIICESNDKEQYNFDKNNAIELFRIIINV
jgi:hypothetical protein